MERTGRDIIARYGADVLRFVSRTIHCHEDAEEVTQDVFVRALRSLERYDEGRASMRTWLMRIAYSEAMRYHERHNKRPMMVALDEHRDDTPETMDEDLCRDLLERAIRRLPDEDRMLLSMRYADGLSIREMAFVTGMKERNLPVRLQRIRERLKTEINKIKD